MTATPRGTTARIEQCQDCQNVDELDDEFEKNLKTREYKKVMNLIDFIMKMSSMKLTYSSDYPYSDAVVLEDATGDPPVFLANSRFFTFIWHQPIVRPLWITYLIFSSMRFLVLLIIRFRLDSTLKEYLSYLRGMSIDKCASVQDLSAKQQQLYERVSQSMLWLRQLGDPIVSINGYSVVIYSVCFWCPLMLYLLGMYRLKTSRRKDIIDALEFLHHPKALRRKINRKLCLIVENIIDTVNNRSSLDKDDADEILIGHAGDVRILNIPQSDNIDQESSHHKVINLILHIHKSNLIKPANLTSQWHKELVQLSYQQIWFLIISFINVSILTITFVLFGELSHRVDQRVAYYECRRERPEVVYASQFLLLEEVEKESDISIYTDPSTNNLISLLLTEFKYYMTPKRLISLIDLINMTSFCVPIFWSPSKYWLFILAVWDRSLWLNQIMAQINHCIDRLSIMRDRLIQDRQHHKDHTRPAIALIDFDRHLDTKLTQILLITYLNYMLFKRQYSDFRHSLNFLMSQFGYFMLIIMGTFYLVALRTEIIYRGIVMYIASAFVLFINMTAISCAWPVRKLQKAMVRINKLLTFDTVDTCPEMKLVLDLWRSQLLDEHELNRVYAFSLLGKYLTFSWVVSFNVNSLALLLLFFH